MSPEQVVVSACVAMIGALALAFVLVAGQVRRLRREVADLRAGLAALESAAGDASAEPSGPPVHSYVITDVGVDHGDVSTAHDVGVPARLEGRLFADIVARETVVKVSGLAHGLRRAASPEVRNRIRFEMRREVKRARRQRRADLKAAMRDLQRRQRGDFDGADSDDESAA